MIFNCKKCKQDTCCTEKDRVKFWKRDWVCDSCWTPIYDRLYPVNVKGAKVFFSPMGNALGDRIVNSVIEDRYRKDNPDEEILFCRNDDYLEMFNLLYGRKKYEKVWWADITNEDLFKYPKLIEKVKKLLDNNGKFWIPDKAIWFGVTNEANAYAKEGIYPVWKEFKRPNAELPQRYAVIHERQIKKIDEKNMEPFVAFKLEKWFIENKLHAVIVGNDERITVEESPYLIDLRKKLSLPEMAWVIKNSLFFFGKDSGLCHLVAACSSAPLIVYGFRSPPWTPKCEPSRLNLFEDGEKAVEYLDKFRTS